MAHRLLVLSDRQHVGMWSSGRCQQLHCPVELTIDLKEVNDCAVLTSAVISKPDWSSCARADTAAQRHLSRGKGPEAVFDVVEGRSDTCSASGRRPRLAFNQDCGSGVADAPSRVVHAYNLDFHDVAVRESWNSGFGVPVVALNDATLSAEHRYGVLKGTRTSVLLTLGTGVGGGLILGGKLFAGGMGRGVELGHMTLRYDGRHHDCGNRGCVEMYCNADALKAGAPGRPVEEVIEGIRAGDPDMEPALERYTDALAGALTSIVNLLDPEVIALGGGVSHAGMPLVEALSVKVQKRSFSHAAPRIELAALGNDAGLVGAAIAHNNL